MDGVEHPPARRVLVSGVGTVWGGRLAQALEADPAIECIIGVDEADPTVPLERTEFVRAGHRSDLLVRIMQGASIDTVIDARLLADGAVHATDGGATTRKLLSACAEAGTRKVIIGSSTQYYGAAAGDPSFFIEDMLRQQAPRTRVERTLIVAEAAAGDFAQRHPDTTVCVLRVCDPIGPGLATDLLDVLGLPVVPGVLGFDPRIQLIAAEDVIDCVLHAATYTLPGIYNCAADGVLALSEVASALGKRWAPLLPPVATGLAGAALRRTGVKVSPQLLEQLRYGRGVDNRRFKATGFRYRYTTRESLLAYAEHLRTARLRTHTEPVYRYDRDVEEFLRRSPSVQRGASEPAVTVASPTPPPVPTPAPEPPKPRKRRAPAAPVSAPLPARYDAMGSEEVLGLLLDLDVQTLDAIHAHEAANRARPSVLAAVDAVRRRQ